MKRHRYEPVQKKQARFLGHYVTYCSIARAAEVARIARSVIYEWLAEDPTFAPRLAEAKQAAIDRVRSVVFGAANKKLDVHAALAILKRLDPEFKDERKPVAPAMPPQKALPTATLNVQGLTDAELNQLESLLLKVGTGVKVLPAETEPETTE